MSSAIKAAERAVDVASEVEVYGVNINALVEAFRLFPNIALRRLVSQGIGTMGSNGEIKIEREAWYPQKNWLAGFNDIAKHAGDKAMFHIGEAVPKHAVFPPTITNIQAGIASIDVAYHMNHRRDGVVMFDPATGKMLEGIGHYGCKVAEGSNHIICECENPYYCDFDRGIISGIAKRFEPHAQVEHDPKKGCRKKGNRSCTFHVTW